MINALAFANSVQSIRLLNKSFNRSQPQNPHSRKEAPSWCPPTASSARLGDVALRGVGPQDRDTCKCVLTALKGNEYKGEAKHTRKIKENCQQN